MNAVSTFYLRGRNCVTKFNKAKTKNWQQCSYNCEPANSFSCDMTIETSWQHYYHI